VSTTVAAFEVLRFEAVPAAAGVALLELDGAFAGPIPQRPRLLVESGGQSRELPAVVDGGSGVGGRAAGSHWSATFAVPIDALDDGGFALVTGRGPVIGLPAPDVAAGEDDRFVRLARGANDLRHRLAEASASATAASARYAELAGERDRLTEELDALRARAEAAEARLEETTSEAAAARGAREEADRAAADAQTELETTRVKLEATTARAEAAEEATKQADAQRDEAAREADRLREEIAAAADHAEGLQARVVAAEDEVRAARRELRDARARLEAMRRERRLPHGAVPAAASPDDVTLHHDVADGEETAGEAPLRWDDDPDATAGLFAEPTDGDRDRFSPAADEEATETATADPTEPMPQVEEPEHAGDAEPPRPARRTIRLEAHDGEDILPPGAVGARYIEPSTTRPPLLALTPERIAVGAALLVLLVALVIILSGGGPV
jgi:hypothetical protein